MNVDVNKPLENPKLSELFEKKKTATGKEVDFYLNEIAREVAMNAMFLVIIKMNENDLTVNNDGTATFNKDSMISFVTFSAQDGALYLPVFTDWNELRKNDAYKNADIKTVIFSFDDIYSLIKNNNEGIVINPFSDNLVLSPQNVQYMKERKDMERNGHSEHVVQKETTVMLGEPKEYPSQMVDAIIQYAKKEKCIEAIWLKLMINGNERSFLLSVDFKGDRQSIFGGIAKAGQPFLPNGMFIDMVPFESDLGKSAATGTPFYKKKKGLFG